jgi:hypothetical protein
MSSTLRFAIMELLLVARLQSSRNNNGIATNKGGIATNKGAIGTENSVIPNEWDENGRLVREHRLRACAERPFRPSGHAYGLIRYNLRKYNDLAEEKLFRSIFDQQVLKR